MSGRKRQPSKLLSIDQIYTGYIKDMGDQSYFMLDDEPVHKVRIFGLVVNRYDGVSRSDREFTSLTIDDGTDTINSTVWSFPTKENGVVVYNPIDQVKGIKVGDIVDILGRVKEYNDEFFISPNSTVVKNDIEWEIHRRTQLLQNELQEKNLLPEERDVFAELRSMESESGTPEASPPTGNAETGEGSTEDLQEMLLETMDDDFEENTVDNLAKKLGKSETEVQDSLQELMMLGEVFERLPGKFQKIDSPV